jgi:hypothetical protein
MLTFFVVPISTSVNVVVWVASKSSLSYFEFAVSVVFDPDSSKACLKSPWIRDTSGTVTENFSSSDSLSAHEKLLVVVFELLVSWLLASSNCEWRALVALAAQDVIVVFKARTRPVARHAGPDLGAGRAGAEQDHRPYAEQQHHGSIWVPLHCVLLLR